MKLAHQKFMSKDLYIDLALDLIDDPHAPMRSEMDEEKLDELARDIKLNGLIQPITVRVVGKRYEVVAGHRRFTASKRAGLATIKCIARVIDEKSADGIRIRENLYREDINPVDEARYIRLMISEHGLDPVDLAKMTGKSEAYLMARYKLLDFPEYIIACLKDETITLSAATWLAKIENDNVRKEYTRFARLGGITAQRAEAWYRSWKIGSLPMSADAYVPPPESAPGAPLKLEMPCLLCTHSDDIELMGMHYAHHDCVRAAREIQSRKTKEMGEPVAALA